ncbi:hypothetical protein NKG94_13335 [Micromonospora sp. M12]
MSSNLGHPRVRAAPRRATGGGCRLVPARGGAVPGVPDRYYEADTLGHLAEAQAEAGDAVGATRSWRTALSLLDDLGHPDAERIRGRLTADDGP